jgi:hypothetical protein
MSKFLLKGLILKEPWIDLILTGEKVWEIRGSNTKIRGTIALIKSGSGSVVGLCDLKDVVGPLSLSKFRRSKSFHAIPSNQLKNGLPYQNTYAWVLDNTICLRKPVSFRHPRGAVIWVNLPNTVVKQIYNQNTLKLQGKENEMTILKKDLQALNRDIKALSKTVDNLLKTVEKGETTKVAKKTTANPIKAKTTKRAPAQKAPGRKRPSSPTATDQVLNIIKRSKKGVNAATLMTKTGFDLKKVRNILQRTFKQGKIKRVGKGIYVKA